MIKEKEITLIIKNVPVSVRQRFKAHCAQMDISMKTGILRLMDLEVEDRILSSPIDGTLQYSDKMIRTENMETK